MGTAPIEQSELRTTSPTRALVVKMGARGGDFRAHMRAIAACSYGSHQTLDFGNLAPPSCLVEMAKKKFELEIAILTGMYT